MMLQRLVPMILSVMMVSSVAMAEQGAPETAAAEGESEPESVPFGEPQPQSIDELIAALQHPDATHRIDAIRALGERDASAAVQPLSRLLRSDPVPEVRGWAVRTLHEIGTDEAHQAVTSAARNDPDERVRSMAADLEGVSSSPPRPAARGSAEHQAQAGRSGQQPQYTPPPPPQQQPQYAYQPPPQTPQRPQRIPGRGLRIAGIISTASSYGLALLVGAALLGAGDEDEWGGERNFVDWGWKLMLPVVGPAVAATTNDAGGEAVIFWLWSAIQVAGITLLSIGYARRARWLREHGGEEEEATNDDRSFGVALLPGPGGVSLGGYF